MTCVGDDLLQALNFFDAEAEINAKEKSNIHIGDEEEKKTEYSQSRPGETEADGDEGDGEGDNETNITAKSKELINNVTFVTDHYSLSTEFTMKLMGAAYVPGMNTISHYNRRNMNEDEQEFSFLEEI